MNKRNIDRRDMRRQISGGDLKGFVQLFNVFLMKQNNKKNRNTNFFKSSCLKKLLNISDATCKISPLLFHA